MYLFIGSASVKGDDSCFFGVFRILSLKKKHPPERGSGG